LTETIQSTQQTTNYQYAQSGMSQESTPETNYKFVMTPDGQILSVRYYEDGGQFDGDYLMLSNGYDDVTIWTDASGVRQMTCDR